MRREAPPQTINALDAFYRFLTMNPHHVREHERLEMNLSNRSFVAHDVHPDGELRQQVIIEFSTDGNFCTIAARQFGYDDSLSSTLGPIQEETRQTYELQSPPFSVSYDDLDRYHDSRDPNNAEDM